MEDNLLNESSDITQSTEQTAPAVEQHEQPSQKELNFRALRERAEKAERKLADIEAAKAPQYAAPQDEDDFGIDDDSLLEGKHLKKYAQSIKKDLKATKDQLAQLNNMNAETRLRAKHPDLDEYVTPENIERLAQEKPSFYRSLMANPDLFDKGDAICDAIKTFIAKPKDYKDQDKKIADNKLKPRSSSVAGPAANETSLARFGEYDRRILSETDKQRIRDRLDMLRSQG
jgi:hypothetical protein